MSSAQRALTGEPQENIRKPITATIGEPITAILNFDPKFWHLKYWSQQLNTGDLTGLNTGDLTGLTVEKHKVHDSLIPRMWKGPVESTKFKVPKACLDSASLYSDIMTHGNSGYSSVLHRDRDHERPLIGTIVFIILTHVEETTQTPVESKVQGTKYLCMNLRPDNMKHG